jgi:hypothetical protein
VDPDIRYFVFETHGECALKKIMCTLSLHLNFLPTKLKAHSECALNFLCALLASAEKPRVFDFSLSMKKTKKV